MTSKTKSQLVTEKDALHARLTELENKMANQLAGRNAMPEDVAIQRQQIEHELSTSEVRYRRLFETAKDGILILDAETGKIEDVNPFLEELLGYTHVELIGRTLWEIGLFKDIAASQSMFRQLQAREYVRYEDLPLETKTGERKQVEFVSNLYLVDGSRVIQCNIRDITSRKQVEIQATEAHKEAVALVGELQRRDTEMQLLYRMNDLLQSCTTQAEAYQVIHLAATDLFSGQNGYLAIQQNKDQFLKTVVSWGGESLMEASFAMTDCWAIRRGQLHEVEDPNTGLHCRHFIREPQNSYLCVPLMVQGETLGVLCLIDSRGGRGERHFNHLQLAVTVGDAIKLSLSNLRMREELQRQASHDPLTGLYNRRYLEDTLSRELYHAHRQKSPLCVAMVDLDHFKGFNDTFGHEAGDILLRRIGMLLREHLRQSDILCRFGGDEFLIVLPDSALEDAQERMDQIRRLVGGLHIDYKDQLLGALTASVGIAIAHEHGWIASNLLRAADEALYTAKEAGRDRVMVNQLQV